MFPTFEQLCSYCLWEAILQIGIKVGHHGHDTPLSLPMLNASKRCAVTFTYCTLYYIMLRAMNSDNGSTC